MSEQPAVPEAPPQTHEDLEKRLEALVAREFRAARREKELQTKATDLERKLRAADDQEERLGTIAQREASLESGNQSLAQSQKDLKRREKTIKDQETSLLEKETRAAEKEAQLNALQAQLRQKSADVDEREIKLQVEHAEVTRVHQESLARAEKCAKDELANKQRADELATAERLVKRREENVKEEEGELNRKKKEFKEREDAVDKLNQTLQARQQTLTVKERENAGDRDRLNKRQAQLEEEERSRVAEIAALNAKRDEVHKAQVAAEEAQEIAHQQQEDASNKIIDSDRKLALLEKQTLENLALQRDLASTKSDLAHFDAELKKRERKVASQSKDNDVREANVAQRKNELDQLDAKLRAFQKELEAKREDLTRQEADFASLKAQHEEDFQGLARLEETLKKKNQVLCKRESELLDWMKEMEWREMMLGDRELEIRREPFPIASLAAPLSLLSGGTNEASATAPGSPGAPSLQFSDRKQSFTAAASSNQGAALSDEMVRMQQRAHGKALIDLQLRRLKDQYVSAQLKWASRDIGTRRQSMMTAVEGNTGGSPTPLAEPPLNDNDDGSLEAAGCTESKGVFARKQPPRVSPSASRMSFRSTAGVATMYGAPSGSSDESDLKRVRALEFHKEAARRASTAFLRNVAKIRAFDLNEPDNSPLKQEQLLVFSEAERMAISFAINLEYLLRHVEIGMGKLLERCPLDEKDKALDAADLLSKTSVWWANSRKSLEQHLLLLLSDRLKYLELGSKTLELHEQELNISNKHTIPSSSSSTTGEPGRRSMTEMFEGRRWDGASAHDAPVAAFAAAGGRDGNTASVDTHLASRLGHIKESPILAPKGAGVLRENKLVDIEVDGALFLAALQQQKEREEMAGAYIPSGDKRSMSFTNGGVMGAAAASFRKGTQNNSAAVSFPKGQPPLSSTTTGDSSALPIHSNSNDITEAVSREATPPSRVPSPAAKTRPNTCPTGVPPSSACGAARGDFGTLTDDAAFCLMRTGRVQTPDPALHGGKRRHQLSGNVNVAGSPARNLSRHLIYTPPLSWGHDRSHESIPKILKMFNEGAIALPPTPQQEQNHSISPPRAAVSPVAITERPITPGAALRMLTSSPYTVPPAAVHTSSKRGAARIGSAKPQ